MSDIISIQPTRELLVPFARWAVAQSPKVRTDSVNSFAVPAHLFAAMPEEILVGSLVDGRRYVSPVEDAAAGRVGARLLDCGLCFEEDGREVHPHPECTADLELLGVATAEGLAASQPPLDGVREAVPGDVLPEASASGYGPDSVPLDPPELDGDGDQPPEVAPFGCGVCSRQFSTARGRDTHRGQKHPEA